MTHALVVQRIERQSSELKIGVRFPSGAQAMADGERYTNLNFIEKKEAVSRFE